MVGGGDGLILKEGKPAGCGSLAGPENYKIGDGQKAIAKQRRAIELPELGRSDIGVGKQQILTTRQIPNTAMSFKPKDMNSHAHHHPPQ